jgi:hypothetical protein
VALVRTDDSEELIALIIRSKRIIELETRKMPSSSMLRSVALVRTDILEERSTSFIKMTRIGELGTTLALTGTDARCEEILCENSSVSIVTYQGGLREL